VILASPLCASRVQRMYHFVHPRLLLRYFYSTSLFNSLRGFWRVPVLEVLDYGRGSDPRQAGLWRGRPGGGGDLLRAVHRPGWFCDILHRNLKEYHRTMLERNLSPSPPPPPARARRGGSGGGDILRRCNFYLIMGIGDEVCIFL